MSWLLLLTVAARAAMPESAFYFNDGKKLFVTDESRRLTVSRSCLQKDGRLKCDAVDRLGRLSWKKLAPGPQNPASLLCEKQLHGAVVLAKTEKGDENSFCRLADGSLVDGGSLIYRARKND